MSQIFDTTMNPSKSELIAAWLPLQPWYGGAPVPQFEVVGGFRLDDPAGEVGLEFIFITETSTGTPTTYQVPLSYRERLMLKRRPACWAPANTVCWARAGSTMASTTRCSWPRRPS